MQVVKLSQKDTDIVTEFCASCARFGYNNNSSIQAMKWGGDFDLPEPAQWWALTDQNRILSISGCHKLSDTELRCLFRSATLPEYANIIPGISRNHMNSVPFSVLLPYQIAWGQNQGYTEFLITTSHGDHDASGKMWRTHRALCLLERRGIVEFVRTETVYYVPQTVWRLVLDRYYVARRAASQIIDSVLNPIHN